LTVEQQDRIDGVFRELPRASLYELLGIPRAADKKAVKRAYNERVMLFHPDRFFRKRLGGFKPKMEAIIVRLTEAHDVLCSPERRREYDERFPMRTASSIESMLEESAAEMRDSGESGRREVVFLERAISVRSTGEGDSPPPPPPAAADRRVSSVFARSAPTPPRGTTISGEHRRAVSPPLPGPRLPTIAELIVQLRGLHDKRKRERLVGAEAVRYAELREDFARTFLDAQRLSLSEGQTYRQALRVACSLRLKLTTSTGLVEGLTADLSEGGLAALVASPMEPGTVCAYFIYAPGGPIRGNGAVVSWVRPPRGSSLYRVSLAFEPPDASTLERLQSVVLDGALAAFKR
jgi:hypothetical protein